MMPAPEPRRSGGFETDRKGSTLRADPGPPHTITCATTCATRTCIPVDATA